MLSCGVYLKETWSRRVQHDWWEFCNFYALTLTKHFHLLLFDLSIAVSVIKLSFPFFLHINKTLFDRCWGDGVGVSKLWVSRTTSVWNSSNWAIVSHSCAQGDESKPAFFPCALTSQQLLCYVLETQSSKPCKNYHKVLWKKIFVTFLIDVFMKINNIIMS